MTSADLGVLFSERTLRRARTYTENVHPDYTTVRSTSQAKSLENKGPTGVKPWGAYVIFDGGEGSRTPVLNTVDAGVSMFRRR